MRRRTVFAIAALCGVVGAIAVASASAADELPQLRFPVLCTLGETCFIQQTMDRDPGPGARDFTCGPMSYDGHSGTDIRLPDRADIARGWYVFAALPGRVRGLRDGVPDTGHAAMREGQDCGNGVAITHEGGWETQYCHLRMGSIAVEVEQEVQAGTILGKIGYSGATEFPHLHLSVRLNGEDVDPFDPSDAATCGAGANALWAVPVPLVPGGFLHIGFSDGVPDYAAVKAGHADAQTLTGSAEALVVWVNLFSGRAGDDVTLRIIGPDGEPFHDRIFTLDRTQAEVFRASGRRAPPQGLPHGLYRGVAELWRDGTLIDRVETVIRVDYKVDSPDL
ncbi:MAG: M23 family metallopeptidase [Rhodobacteraceae bacterium]|nr:M23 family metallopeptidase [Paracoccaceae bacterium]